MESPERLGCSSGFESDRLNNLQNTQLAYSDFFMEETFSENEQNLDHLEDNRCWNLRSCDGRDVGSIRQWL